jgi:hypothetical protein
MRNSCVLTFMIGDIMMIMCRRVIEKIGLDVSARRPVWISVDNDREPRVVDTGTNS